VRATHRSFLETTSMTSSWQHAESRNVRKVAWLRLTLPVESLRQMVRSSEGQQP
jgi:hypothetical protein